MSGGKVWVVTGASRGIGAAIARMASESGDRVALIARGESVLTLADELGPDTIGVQCDVANPKAVSAAMEAVIARFGRADTL